MPRRLTAARVIAASLFSLLALAPNALAQTRPAFTRDVDNPALQPYRTVDQRQRSEWAGNPPP